MLSDLQDVQDSHEEAARVAPQALKLCSMVCLLYASFYTAYNVLGSLTGQALPGGLHAMTISNVPKTVCCDASTACRFFSSAWSQGAGKAACLCSSLRGCCLRCMWWTSSTQTYIEC